MFRTTPLVRFAWKGDVSFDGRDAVRNSKRLIRIAQSTRDTESAFAVPYGASNLVSWNRSHLSTGCAHRKRQDSRVY